MLGRQDVARADKKASPPAVSPTDPPDRGKGGAVQRANLNAIVGVKDGGICGEGVNRCCREEHRAWKSHPPRLSQAALPAPYLERQNGLSEATGIGGGIAGAPMAR